MITAQGLVNTDTEYWPLIGQCDTNWTLIGQTASLLLVSGVIDEVDGILAVFEVTGTGEYKLK